MEIRMDGKVAVISGGTGNLGKALAKRFAECGASVAIIARDAEKLAKVEAEINEIGKCKAFVGDITKVAESKALVERIRAELGEIDALVNSAAKMIGGDSLDITEETWDDAFALNPKGMFFLMKEVVGQSMKDRGGAIVNISSMAGVRGMALPLCNAVYSATKGAVNALTMQAATEWGQYNVKCNALAPGAIMPDVMPERPPMPKGDGPKGPMGEGPGLLNVAPLGHSVKQSEITNMAVYLCSDLNQSVTGQIMIMDGGSSVLGF